jgi:hypothetical protein
MGIIGTWLDPTAPVPYRYRVVIRDDRTAPVAGRVARPERAWNRVELVRESQAVRLRTRLLFTVFDDLYDLLRVER